MPAFYDNAKEDCIQADVFARMIIVMYVCSVIGVRVPHVK